MFLFHYLTWWTLGWTPGVFYYAMKKSPNLKNGDFLRRQYFRIKDSLLAEVMRQYTEIEFEKCWIE